MTYDPVATAPGSVTFLSPVSRALYVELAFPSTEVLGYFHAVRFADVNDNCFMNNLG